MSRTVPAVLTTAVLAVAAVITASTPARWAVLAAATLVFHFAYLLFVMLGALLGLRDVRWLGVHLLGVVWGVVGLVMTKRCPVTLLEKLLWEKAGLVVGVYVLAIRSHLRSRRARRSPSPILAAKEAPGAGPITLRTR